VQDAIESQNESKRRDRRRSEAKNAIALGNVVNGPDPIDSDDGEFLMHPGMNMSGNVPSHQTDKWNPWARQPMVNPMSMTIPNPQQFMIPTPSSGADMHFLAAHQQAMMIAKQTYQIAVAQQAMAAAGEEWERNSTVSGIHSWGGSSMIFPGAARSVYAGSVVGGSSNYGGGWGSRSVYGEHFGPALNRQSIAGHPMQPASFTRSMAKEGPHQRDRSSVQDGGGPPTSWKRR